MFCEKKKLIMGPNQLPREIFNEITKEYKGGILPNQLQRNLE